MVALDIREWVHGMCLRNARIQIYSQLQYFPTHIDDNENDDDDDENDNN